MTEQPPKVAIIVLTWENEQDTSECLESLFAQTYSNFEVYLVDNASTKVPPQLFAARFPKVHIVRNEENLGYAEGNNRGIRAALSNGADYVLVLNNDTKVDPLFLFPLIKALESDNSIGGACPKLLHYSRPTIVQYAGSTISEIRGRNYFVGYDKPDGPIYDRLIETENLSGAAMILPRRILETVGLFDPIYFLILEDQDLAVRIRKAGYKLVCVGESKVYHKGSVTFGGYFSPVASYFNHRNKIIYARKHLSLRQKLLFSAYFTTIYLPGYTLAALWRGKPQNLMSILRGIGWHLFPAKRLPDARMVEKISVEMRR